MIPTSSVMRLPPRESYNVLIIGMPPNTDASKRKSTWFLYAKSNKYGPASANKSLLAVTTLFPCFKAASTQSFANVVPPINSTTIAIDSSLRTSSMLVTYCAVLGSVIFVYLSGLRTNIFEISIVTPLLLVIKSTLSCNKLKVPWETVPNPNKAILTVFIMVLLSSDWSI